MTRTLVAVVAMASAACAACGGAEDTDDGGTTKTGSGGLTGEGGASTGSGGQGGGQAGGQGGQMEGGGTPSGGAGASSDVVYSFDFEGADGASWPAPWAEAGGVDQADLLGGRARLSPSLGQAPYPLARMALSAAEQNVEATFVMTLTTPSAQGFGFYVRQNGGHLGISNPPGEGYAVFISNAVGANSGVSVWVETAGAESALAATPYALVGGMAYRVRFRVTQPTAGETRLSARIWPDGSSEPATWTVEHLTADPHLQGVPNGFAVDAYWANQEVPDDLYLDDLEIVRLP
jgi:hypothetical protein